MLIKPYLSRLVALVLVVVIGLMGCSSDSVTGLTGDYRQDTFALLQSLRTAIELPEDAPDKRRSGRSASKN
jgi:photosystem II Psb27 protein